MGVGVVQRSGVYCIQSKARDFSERSGGVKAILSPQCVCVCVRVQQFELHKTFQNGVYGSK